MSPLSESFNSPAAPNTPTLTMDKVGARVWRLPNGQLHREDGPAIERANGTKAWYVNGLPHREDGPAYEGADGSKEWWLHGKLHREDGPAIETAKGSKAWCLNGQQLTETAFNQWREERAKTRQADLAVFTTGLDEPFPVNHGKLKFRAPSR